MDYQGEEQVQECMEYYLDSGKEQAVINKILGQEREAADRDAGSGQWASLPPRGIVTYLLMENAERTLHLDMLLSLHCLGKFFGDYPVAIFHTNASTPAELDKLRRDGPKGMRLIFEE